MTHAEAMAATLAARGVDTVLGLPGGEILAFVDACRRAGIRFLLTGHEASAAWIAQVMGQLTGTPGVCASTLGPGAMNLVTAVSNAWLDRAPMLAVTAQIPKAAIQTHTHQRLPLDRLFAPITKASVSIGGTDTAKVIHESLDLALVPRPGPVHLSLESDVATQECGTSAGKPDSGASEGVPASIQPILDRVQAATRPLILIGLGATPDAAPAIRALIDKLQCPFLVTAKVKGIVSDEDERFAGVASGMALDREVVETLRQADLVVAIGFDPVECDKTWFPSLNVAAIDSISMVEGDYRPLEVIGDVAKLVLALAAGISTAKPWPAELLEARRRAMRPALSGTPSPDGVSPMRLVEELRAVFPRDGIATCDVGSHKFAMGQFWKTYEPGTFLMSNGLSGMGFGLPSAIAAQLVYPEKSVITVVGDGGMLMMVHDLAMIRELRLPILMVVFRDASLSLIRLSGERRGYPAYGVDFTPPEFTLLAQGFGIASAKAHTLKEARELAQRALESRAPFLLEVPVDWQEYREVIR